MVYAPNGDRFLTPVELAAERNQARDRAEQERARAEQERARADRAEAERAMLLDRLRALGIDPEQLQ